MMGTKAGHLPISENTNIMSMQDSNVANPTGQTSAYYSITKRMPLASRLSFRARRKMFDTLMNFMCPTESTTVLDLGVTCDVNSPESNFFEELYPYKHRIVCAGTEAAYHLESKYPGTRFLQVTPDARLPFPDRHFDMVFSNAVIEHAGGRDAQRRFVS